MSMIHNMIQNWAEAHLCNIMILELMLWICFTGYVYFKALVYQRGLYETERNAIYLESGLHGAAGHSMAIEAFRITKVFSLLFMGMEALVVILIMM